MTNTKLLINSRCKTELSRALDSHQTLIFASKVAQYG